MFHNLRAPNKAPPRGVCDMHPTPGKDRRHDGDASQCARPTGSQAVCVAWSGFRQNGVISSHLVVEPVEITSPHQGATQYSEEA